MNWFNLTPASEDVVRVIKEEHEEFQKAIGKLVLTWADMEKVVRATLRHYAGVSRPVGRALFSGLRARAALEMIEAIAHNTDLGQPRRDDMKEVFPVIKAINTMRDFLVHHVDGSLIESDDADPRMRKLSNDHASSREGNGKTFWVSSATVYDMCHDLTECCWRLQAHWEKDPFQQGVGPLGAPSPWRYRPPQPVGGGR